MESMSCASVPVSKPLQTFISDSSGRLNSVFLKFVIGLKKSPDYEKCFELLEQYIKTRKELQVLYTAKGSYNVIDFKQIRRLDLLIHRKQDAA